MDARPCFPWRSSGAGRRSVRLVDRSGAREHQIGMYPEAVGPRRPVSPVELEVPKIPLEQAISAALTNRQEIAQLQTSAEINKINEKFFRDQTKPQIDLVAMGEEFIQFLLAQDRTQSGLRKL